MQNDLQKVLNLAKKTGDRVIVFDYNKPENTYVVMGLEEYEMMVGSKGQVRGLTEDRLLDKINRDIALWKSEHDFSVSNDVPNDRAEAKNEARPGVDAADHDDRQDKKAVRKGNWSIPKTVKEAAERVMEEDRPYAEEVNF
jgi:hypothetical protein